jgi:hypothetical protein
MAIHEGLDVAEDPEFHRHPYSLTQGTVRVWQLAVRYRTDGAYTYRQ